jgi:hypothetical protein
MFDSLNLLVLLLAPVLAYATGAMMFFVYELIHKNNAQPFLIANRALLTFCLRDENELLFHPYPNKPACTQFTEAQRIFVATNTRQRLIP